MSDFLKQRKDRIALASASQRAATNPSASVWVEASAGTGKTKVLSDRVLRLLLDGTNPTRILCLTYTKAAAVEMNNRIAGRLSKWAVMSNETLTEELENLLGAKLTSFQNSDALLRRARRLFALLLDTPGGIKIQTIHSFCQEILKRFPLEAKISPYFEVMDDRSAKEALNDIKNTLLKNPPTPELNEALQTLTSSVSEYSFPDILKDITEQRNTLESYFQKHPNFDSFLSQIAKKLGVSADETSENLEALFWKNLPQKDLSILIKALSIGSTASQKKGLELKTALTQKNLSAYQKILLTKEKTLPSKFLVKKSLETYPEALVLAQAEADRLCHLLELKTAVALLNNTKAVLTLAREMLALYRTYKKNRSKMDYNDLIVFTKTLLSDPKTADWILYKLDGGIDNILIDEAQDTSPEQWSIIKSLTDEFFSGEGSSANPTVFVVGDRKQSIYSFQGADPQEFEKMYEHFFKKAKNFQTIKMDVSFRSTAAVLDVVNSVFNTPKAKDGVVQSAQEITHVPARIGDGGRIELWPLTEAENDEDTSAVWLPPVEKVDIKSPSSRLASKIAETIKAKVTSGEQLQSRGRPVEYRDFLILVQRRNSFVEEIVRACKNIGVAVTGVDKISLNENLAVNDLIAAAKFVLLPEDDLNLACLLKSPLFNLTDEDLIELCCNRGSLSLWQRLMQNTQFGAVSNTLQSLVLLAQTSRPFEFFAHILTALNGRKKFISRLGYDCEDALDEFINLTLNFEQEHIPSLQLFVEWMAQDDVEIKRDLEQNETNAVRLMTVHGSKGLQAPIVILPDTVRVKIPNNSAGLLKDKDILLYPLGSTDYEKTCASLKETEKNLSLQEYHRLLYVALTRAEECLCICGYTGKKRPNEESWYELVRQSFIPLAETLPDGRLVYTLPQQISPQSSETPKQDISHPSLPVWLNERPKAEHPLAKPLTPSHQDESLISALPPLERTLSAKLYRRGSLIHKLLEFLPNTAPQNRASLCKTFLDSQASDFSQQEKQKILSEVLSLISDSKFEALFSKDSLAEVSVMGEVENRIISGQIDRLVVLDKKVMIVDYKTNRPAAKTLQDVPEAYKKQLAAYKKVVSAIYPNKQIETYILWTNTAQMMQIE